MTMLTVWIIYAVIGVGISCAVFLWAVRARQFSDQDRARYLALNAEALPPELPTIRRPAGADRYTWVALLLIMFLVLATTLWLGAVTQLKRQSHGTHTAVSQHHGGPDHPRGH